MSMGIYFPEEIDGNDYISLQEHSEVMKLLEKAAGYLPHCPCGCSPAKLARSVLLPDPIIRIQYELPDVGDTTPSGQPHDAPLYAALAERIAELLPLARLIDRGEAHTAEWLAKQYKWCADHEYLVCYT